MAKVAVDVVLKDGEDSTAFGNSFSSNSDVEVKNPMDAIPTLITLNVEESYIDTIKADSRVLAANRDLPTLEPGTVPGFTSVGPKTVVSTPGDVSTGQPGYNYMPLQMYLDQDNMDGAPLGTKTFYSFLHVTQADPNEWTNDTTSDLNGTNYERGINQTIEIVEGCKLQLYPESNVATAMITGVTNHDYQITYSDRYRIDDAVAVNDPTINVQAGDAVDFWNKTNTTGHPLYIKTAATTGTGDLVTTGTLTGAQGQEGVANYSLYLRWNTTGVTPGTYYYQCSAHAGMGGQIIVHAAGSLYNHPLYIKTAATTGTGDQLAGVTNQGSIDINNHLEYTFPAGSAGTYYYQCSLHASMGGEIIVHPATSVKVGKLTQESADKITDATYSSRWTGKFVDIVTCEAGSSTMVAANYHNGHTDFDDLDNPGTSRMIPKDWSPYGLNSDRNKDQVTTGVMNTSHGMGVLSVSGGSVCGYAKKAKLYQTTAGGTNPDTIPEIINGIVAWHNAKTGNPNNNNLKDPTIIIGEVQWLLGRRNCYPISSVNTIKSPSGDVTRPGAGWGTDFSEFVNRDIIPWQVKDPSTGNFVWCVVLPYDDEYAAVNTAIDAAWDAGVIFIGAAGNDGGTYVKTSDARYNGEYLKIDANSDKYVITPDSNFYTQISKTTTSNSIEDVYPWRNHGIHGRDKAIDVAAGQNSETWQTCDSYSNRGPGIDIIGRGSSTWSSSPKGTAYADGKEWDWFGGTSCATPTVVGKAACLMEKYMVYNNVWPTPAQIKELLLESGDNDFQESWAGRRGALHPSKSKVYKSGVSVNWASVGDANTKITAHADNGGTVNRIDVNWSMNGWIEYVDPAGTPRKYASLNTKGFDRFQTRGPRPKSGALYPRPRIQRHKIYPEFP